MESGEKPPGAGGGAKVPEGTENLLKKFLNTIFRVKSSPVGTVSPQEVIKARKNFTPVVPKADTTNKN